MYALHSAQDTQDAFCRQEIVELVFLDIHCVQKKIGISVYVKLHMSRSTFTATGRLATYT